jgi:hypothetical protein
LHVGYDLLQLLEKRRVKKVAIEYFGTGSRDIDEQDEVRITQGAGHNFIRLRHLRFEERGGYHYAIMLFEYVDHAVRSFPVVNTQSFAGREIEGEPEERGATSAHVVVRFPKRGGDFDDGRYRCAIESTHGVTRKDIEVFLCKQLRRQAHSENWVFSVDVKSKKKGRVTDSKPYRYWPRLELFADIGRKLDVALTGTRILSHMHFIKRSEKQNMAQPTSVAHKEVIADVEYRVTAKQGPTDATEKKKWLESVRTMFEQRGYESRMYYRHINGSMLSGDVHNAVAGATDLLMCPREIISLSKEPKRWQSTTNSEIAEKMIELVDKNDLWQLGK